jgi:putative endonuclease
MTSSRRAQAEKSGRWAEHVAALILQVKGYAILGRRVQTPSGEIDLIARRGDVLAFIEVKMRQKGVNPADILRSEQMARIVRAATGWTARRDWTRHFSWRYDLIVVRPWHWPVHVRDAWRPQHDPMVPPHANGNNVISFRARRR